MSGKLILNLKRKRSALEASSSEHNRKIPNLEREIESCAADGQIINLNERGNETSKRDAYLGSYKQHIPENGLKNLKITNGISIRNINDINNDVSLYYNQQNNEKYRENINNFSQISKNINNGNDFVQQSRHSPEKLDAICSKIANVCKGQQQRPRNLNQRLRTENHARVFKNDNINNQHIIDDNQRQRNENFVQEQAGDNRNRADFLKLALERLNELQEELCNDEYDSEDEDDDDDFSLFENSPETLGYAVCVKETMAYLAAQGMTPDNPLIINLRNSLIDALPM